MPAPTSPTLRRAVALALVSGLAPSLAAAQRPLVQPDPGLQQRELWLAFRAGPAQDAVPHAGAAELLAAALERAGASARVERSPEALLVRVAVDSPKDCAGFSWLTARAQVSEDELDELRDALPAAPGPAPSTLAAALARELTGPSLGVLAPRPDARSLAALDADSFARLVRARLSRGAVGVTGPGELEPLVEALAANPPLDPAPGPAGARAPRSGPGALHLCDLPDADAVELCLLGAPAERAAPGAEALALAAGRLDEGELGELLRAALAGEPPVHADAAASLIAGFAGAGRVEAWVRVPAADAELALERLLVDFPAALAERVADDRPGGRAPSGGPPTFEERLLACLHGLDEARLDAHRARLAAADPDAAAAWLRASLAPERRTLIALGPAERLGPLLARHGAVQRVAPVADADPAALVEELYAALGGRDAWREARFVELDLSVLRAGAPPAALHVLRDLDAPRMRIESEAGGLSSTFVLDEQRALSRAGDRVQELPPATHAELVARSWRDVHCVLRQTAAAPPGALRAAGPRRLEWLSAPLAGLWIELGDDGRPARAGVEAEGGAAPVSYLYEDWREYDGLIAPARVSMQPDGWVREIASARFLAALDAGLFERP